MALVFIAFAVLVLVGLALVLAGRIDPGVAGTDRPVDGRKPLYDTAYDLFCRAYRTLEPLFGDLAAMQRVLATQDTAETDS